MKRIALVIIAALAALAAAQGGAAKSGPVLAIAGQGSAARLGYVDPVSLKLVGRSTQVGYCTWPSARSPDGSRLALARNYLTSGLRIMDLRRMRSLTAFKLPYSETEALSWVAPRKILAAVGGDWVVAMDPVTGKRLWERSLPALFDAVATTTDGFVFLSSPADDYQNVIGAATLTSVSSSGVLRYVVLDRIRTGSQEPTDSSPLGVQRRAGLAVDVAGNRAFVVGAGEPIAEVDLGSLAVIYHGGSRTLAKLLDGPYREATWLPNGTIAVTGYDGHVSKDASGKVTESQSPAGLAIVDPRDWSWKTVDPATSSLVVAGNVLVAYSWFANAGLAVYGLDGTARSHPLAGTVDDVQLAGGLAFATMANGQKLAVVDLASGHVLRTAPATSANILLVG